ncbi:hypothetical protein [Catellatospora sp. NPDC049609]|uniref:hypothetical protein n=1 Tax=Catellatospora sp. NPDC049609 TaxID=3155505 RepID=UPI0034172557
MSENPRLPWPPGGSFRLHLTGERIRVENADAEVDVPLACLADYQVTETPDPEVFDLRICLEVRVTEVMLRHRGNISVFEALRRSWEAASGRLPGRGPAAAEPLPHPGPAGSPGGPAEPSPCPGGPAESDRQGEDGDDTAVVAEPAPPARVEPEPVLRGPALVPDAPEWIVFGPLADTRRLSRAELMITDPQQAPG